MAGKTKSDLVNEVAKRAELNKTQSKKVLDIVLDSIQKELQAGRKITLSPLGNFSIRQRAARQGRNPSTGKPIQIPAQNDVKFTPSKNLKDRFK